MLAKKQVMSKLEWKRAVKAEKAGAAVKVYIEHLLMLTDISNVI